MSDGSKIDVSMGEGKKEHSSDASLESPIPSTDGPNLSNVNAIDSDLKGAGLDNSDSDKASESEAPAVINSAGIHCGFCGKLATLQCAGCHNIKYCNKQCQKQDWTLADFNTPPGRGYRRVIVLPRYSNEPHFAWMETWVCSPEDDEDEDDYDGGIDEESGLPEFDTEPGSEIANPARLFDSSFRSYNEIVAGKIGHGENLDHCIAVYLEENHQYPTNQCLNFLTDGKAARELWLAGRGLIVIYTTAKSMQSKFVRDANCGDLTLGIKGWLEYNRQYGGRRY
ncbi:hypothetical protein PRZ48_004203 [Zasmidium cellare]|uniref:MYND-type domain-containing protein n=1 Tax=Zasmidium cellare TaxID=395010 RepID=A0ABR0EYF8_ZASCE|nr:hypothetical protein PRZ48_004203 [Zasmidium cellare]